MYLLFSLQDELIKVRLREAENEESIRHLEGKVSELEEEKKKMREAVPENDVASLQEELAAAKLREAEANLALKDLKSKVKTAVDEENEPMADKLKDFDKNKLKQVKCQASTK